MQKWLEAPISLRGTGGQHEEPAEDHRRERLEAQQRGPWQAVLHEERADGEQGDGRPGVAQHGHGREDEGEGPRDHEALHARDERLF